MHRLGSVRDNVLNGQPVLIVSGDFSFALRWQPSVEFGFCLPNVDHTISADRADGAEVEQND